MSYSESELKDSLVLMFTVAPNPVTMQQHCVDFARIYNDYAKNVLDSVASNPLTTNGKSAFQTSLEAYLSLPIPILSGYASAVESACISYWNSCVFSLTNVPVAWSFLESIEITPMTPSSISTDLSSLLSASKGDPQSLATSMASIIHTATSTVSLLLSGTSSGGSSISSPATLS